MSVGGGGTSTMKALIERFRNAPPMPREEREKMRTSGNSETGSSLWWKDQEQKMNETVMSVQKELESVSMENTFGAAEMSSRWANVGGFSSSAAATVNGLSKLSPEDAIADIFSAVGGGGAAAGASRSFLTRPPPSAPSLRSSDGFVIPSRYAVGGSIVGGMSGGPPSAAMIAADLDQALTTFKRLYRVTDEDTKQQEKKKEPTEEEKKAAAEAEAKAAAEAAAAKEAEEKKKAEEEERKRKEQEEEEERKRKAEEEERERNHKPSISIQTAVKSLSEQLELGVLQYARRLDALPSMALGATATTPAPFSSTTGIAAASAAATANLGETTIGGSLSLDNQENQRPPLSLAASSSSSSTVDLTDLRRSMANLREGLRQEEDLKRLQQEAELEQFHFDRLRQAQEQEKEKRKFLAPAAMAASGRLRRPSDVVIDAEDRDRDREGDAMAAMASFDGLIPPGLEQQHHQTIRDLLSRSLPLNFTLNNSKQQQQQQPPQDDGHGLLLDEESGSSGGGGEVGAIMRELKALDALESVISYQHQAITQRAQQQPTARDKLKAALTARGASSINGSGRDTMRRSDGQIGLGGKTKAVIDEEQEAGQEDRIMVARLKELRDTRRQALLEALQRNRKEREDVSVKTAVLAATKAGRHGAPSGDVTRSVEAALAASPTRRSANNTARPPSSSSGFNILAAVESALNGNAPEALRELMKSSIGGGTARADTNTTSTSTSGSLLPPPPPPPPPPSSVSSSAAAAAPPSDALPPTMTMTMTMTARATRLELSPEPPMHAAANAPLAPAPQASAASDKPKEAGAGEEKKENENENGGEEASPSDAPTAATAATAPPAITIGMPSHIPARFTPGKRGTSAEGGPGPHITVTSPSLAQQQQQKADSSNSADAGPAPLVSREGNVVIMGSARTATDGASAFSGDSLSPHPHPHSHNNGGSNSSSSSEAPMPTSMPSVAGPKLTANSTVVEAAESMLVSGKWPAVSNLLHEAAVASIAASAKLLSTATATLGSLPSGAGGGSGGSGAGGVAAALEPLPSTTEPVPALAPPVVPPLALSTSSRSQSPAASSSSGSSSFIPLTTFIPPAATKHRSVEEAVAAEVAKTRALQMSASASASALAASLADGSAGVAAAAPTTSTSAVAGGSSEEAVGTSISTASIMAPLPPLPARPPIAFAATSEPAPKHEALQAAAAAALLPPVAVAVAATTNTAPDATATASSGKPPAAQAAAAILSKAPTAAQTRAPSVVPSRRGSSVFLHLPAASAAQTAPVAAAQSAPPSPPAAAAVAPVSTTNSNSSNPADSGMYNEQDVLRVLRLMTMLKEQEQKEQKAATAAPSPAEPPSLLSLLQASQTPTSLLPPQQQQQQQQPSPADYRRPSVSFGVANNNSNAPAYSAGAGAAGGASLAASLGLASSPQGGAGGATNFSASGFVPSYYQQQQQAPPAPAAAAPSPFIPLSQPLNSVIARADALQYSTHGLNSVNLYPPQVAANASRMPPAIPSDISDKAARLLASAPDFHPIPMDVAPQAFSSNGFGEATMTGAGLIGYGSINDPRATGWISPDPVQAALSGGTASAASSLIASAATSGARVAAKAGVPPPPPLSAIEVALRGHAVNRATAVPMPFRSATRELGELQNLHEQLEAAAKTRFGAGLGSTLMPKVGTEKSQSQVPQGTSSAPLLSTAVVAQHAMEALAKARQLNNSKQGTAAATTTAATAAVGRGPGGSGHPSRRPSTAAASSLAHHQPQQQPQQQPQLGSDGASPNGSEEGEADDLVDFSGPRQG